MASGSESTWVIGYGSLMTAAGLGAQLPGARDLWRVAVRGRRAFGKPVKRGGCLAMDLVGEHGARLEARVLGPEEPAPDGWFGALLLEFAEEEWPGLVVREGYGAESWAGLRAAAGPDGVAALLTRLAAEANDERIAYREALRAVSGPPTTFRECHYLPHPVRVEGLPGAEAAVFFVSPEAGESGDPAQPAIKARFPALRPVPIAEAFPPPGYDAYDPARQRRYVELCLLAAAHGIGIGDLIGGRWPDVVSLPARAALEEERAGFARLLGARYAARFPADLEAAWGLSGLEATCPSS